MGVFISDDRELKRKLSRIYQAPVSVKAIISASFEVLNVCIQCVCGWVHCGGVICGVAALKSTFSSIRIKVFCV